MSQKSLKFGDLKLSHTPETKNLGHRQGEHRVLTETRKTRWVTDCSSVKSGGCELPAPGLERGAPPHSSQPSALKVFREQNSASELAGRHPD